MVGPTEGKHPIASQLCRSSRSAFPEIPHEGQGLGNECGLLKRNATAAAFTLPKSKAGIRTLPLPALGVAELLLHLSQYSLGPTRLLFTTPAGTVLNQNNWRRREWYRTRMWAY